MNGNATSRELAAAEAEIESVCGLLTKATPAGLEECERTLGKALERLRAGLAAAPADRGDADALASALALRRVLVRAGRLLDDAGDYRLQWMRRLETMLNGYTAAGEPAPLEGGRLLLRG